MERGAPLLVGLGGFVGAIARYGVDIALDGATATLAVNVVGSLALGLLVASLPGRRTQLLVGTGLLSSFTTYSTFSVETVALGPVAGGGNVAATYGLGVGAALVGLSAGKRLSDGHPGAGRDR